MLANAKARTGAADAFPAIDAIVPVSAADAAFLRAIACQAQQKPAEALRHIERGLDSLMASPWCRASVVSEGLGLLAELGKSKDIVQEPRFTVIFDKLARDYPVQIERSIRLGMRCEMATHLQVSHQLAAVESLGLPMLWNGRALAIRVSAYLQAGDPRLGAALEEMNRFLDQGGKIGGEVPPFSVQVKPSIPATAPVQEMVLGAQPGE